MSRTISLTPLRVVAVGGALAAVVTLAGTGGAVAAKLVTSADIKDHTIQTRDVSDPALSAFTTLQGYEIVRNEVVVPARSQGSLVGTCPASKRATGVSAFWDGKDLAVQSTVLSDGTGGLALVDNKGAQDTLNIRVICADVG